MNVTKRNNYPVFGDMMANFFEDDFFQPFATNRKSISVPKVNIKENDKEFTVEAVLAGMKKDEIEIDVKENQMKIVAEKKTNKTEEKKEGTTKEKYTLKEFSHTKFQRSFTLPKGIDKDNIKANFEDGILSVSIPKKEPKAPKTRNIKIS
ncbi:MAG: Hsp20/alpha crystallin family protein [Flavobacteriales bacterium]|nr:Hsp20/alpha crystallin family protein [Flavobacteriales bacterium]